MIARNSRTAVRVAVTRNDTGRWGQVAVCIAVLLTVIVVHVLVGIVSDRAHRVQFGPVAVAR